MPYCKWEKWEKLEIAWIYIREVYVHICAGYLLLCDKLFSETSET